MKPFEGKRVLVTGSGRGIGRAIARRFAEGGARVHLTARTQQELDSARNELLGLTAEVRATAIDLLLPASASELVNEVAANWGGLDIVVGNAGAAAQGSFLELEDNAWEAGFGLKMFANLRVIRHAWPMLKASRGHLVMIGGGTARTPDRRLSLVSAINGGLAALSKSIAEQGIADSVHVNLVQPGTVNTTRRQKLFEKWSAEQGIPTEDFVKNLTSDLRVTRLGQPSDIANVVSFLCSEESSWIQGAILDVDGGQNKGI